MFKKLKAFLILKKQKREKYRLLKKLRKKVIEFFANVARCYLRGDVLKNDVYLLIKKFPNAFKIIKELQAEKAEMHARAEYGSIPADVLENAKQQLEKQNEHLKLKQQITKARFGNASGVTTALQNLEQTLKNNIDLENALKALKIECIPAKKRGRPRKNDIVSQKAR